MNNIKIISLCVLLILVIECICSCRKSGENDDNSTTYESTSSNEIVTTINNEETSTSTETSNKINDTTNDETISNSETSSDGNIHVTGIKLDKYEVEISVGGNDMPWVTMSPSNATNVGEIWTSSNSTVATVNEYGKIVGVTPGTCTVTVKSKDNPSVKADVKVVVKEAAGITYIDGILIANKTYSLPADYNPGVDSTAEGALNKMIAAAASEGINLWVISGFRSYERQSQLYNNYVARDGKEAADTYSARPGYSEHQTGLAFDLNSLEESFGQTKEGQWLANNCYKYGFIIRYPKEKESVTGYIYEPWHVRYLGNDVAKKVYDSGKCLEEYLGITSKYAN